jgi:hypothetical protein
MAEMIPALCRVKHDPEAGTYGDCMRACIATMLSLDTEDVPHFYHDDCDGVTGQARIRDWLALRGYTMFITGIEGYATWADIMEMMSGNNSGVAYLLIGTLESGGRHAVVCQGGTLFHNPAWIAEPFKPAAEPWVICVIVPLL